MKILLLQLKRIGDLILTTPAIAALREHFPQAELTIVVSSECADLLPAIAGVDRILMARRNLSDLAAFLAVAGNKFDYCIDFTRNDRSAFLVFLSGAGKRIVSYRVRDQSKSRARLYTDFVNVRMRDLHTVDYNLSLLKPLGIGSVSSSLHLQLPQSAHEKADALRRNSNVRKSYIVLLPGSARQEKLWEAGRWARIIERFGFFFSSRRRHTRCSRDWSSDVCSSDLDAVPRHTGPGKASGRGFADQSPRHTCPSFRAYP